MTLRRYEVLVPHWRMIHGELVKLRVPEIIDLPDDKNAQEGVRVGWIRDMNANEKPQVGVPVPPGVT